MRKLTLLILGFSLCAHAQSTIDVEFTNTLKSGKSALGLSLNQINDGALSRDSLVSGVKSLGTKVLRFPEGESADNYLWSVPPYDKARPHVASLKVWPGTDRKLVASDGSLPSARDLNFDEFMSVAKSSGAKVNLVLCYPCNDKKVALDAAKGWVRYAKAKYPGMVLFWELGNETSLGSYIDDTFKYKGYKMPAKEYAQDLINFARELKAIDPKVRLAANGHGTTWWSDLFSYRDSSGRKVADWVDYAVVHDYPLYGKAGLSDYQQARDLRGPVKEVVAAISKWAPRLRVAVTEFNSMSFTSADINNTGNAIIVGDILAQLASEPKVDFVELWGSRWVKSFSSSAPPLSDTLSPSNGLHASGRVTQIWAGALRERMLGTRSTSSSIRSYATYSPTSGEINVMLFNTSSSSKSVSVNFKNWYGSAQARYRVFRGDDFDDVTPSYDGSDRSLSMSGTRTSSISLPAVSMTLVKILVRGSPRITELTGISSSGRMTIEAKTKGTALRTDLIIKNSAGTVVRRCNDSSAPYTCDFDSRSLPDGNYFLLVWAYDSSWKTTSGAWKTFAVKNP